MEVLLDSSFIVSCIMKRIDFLEELKNMGFKSILPREVLQELKDLKLKDKTSHEERVAIDLAFQMFEKSNVKKTTIGGRYADEGLIEKGNQGFYIATLDRGIKNKVPNKIVISKAKNGLEVIRD